jgi:hypothetical protein
MHTKHTAPAGETLNTEALFPTLLLAFWIGTAEEVVALSGGSAHLTLSCEGVALRCTSVTA